MKENKINTAILGYGFSGSVFFAPFLNLHDGFELKGAWERSKKKIQNDYPYVYSYSSLEEILNDRTVDLVVVNTSIDTHYTYAKKSLIAGKHVIVEKHLPIQHKKPKNCTNWQGIKICICSCIKTAVSTATSLLRKNCLSQAN